MIAVYIGAAVLGLMVLGFFSFITWKYVKAKI